MHIRLALGLALSLTTSTIACSIKNPDFCCSDLASCQSAGVSEVIGCADPSAPYCDDQGTYGAARACIADPGTNACGGPSDCLTAARPVCDVSGTGTCVGCAVTGDCARFAANPWCDDASGACVACRTSADCGAATPVCGPDHVCRACVADGDCSAGLCAASGACPATGDVVYVDGDAPAGNAECTAAAPCRTIAGGLGQVTVTRRFLSLRPGLYNATLDLNNRALEISGAGAEVSTALSVPVMEVRNGSNVTVTGVRFRSGGSHGVRCADATLVMRGVGLEDNRGRGLEGSGCILTLERARVLRNFGGGVVLSSGRATVRNSFLGKNGNTGISFGGASVVDLAELTFEFNTLAENQTMAAVAAGLICRTATSVVVANNIIVGDGAKQVDAATCVPRFTMSNEMIAGATNLVATPSFRNPAGSDYHLNAGSPGIDLADPAATVIIDIDREPRPHGGRADLGADEQY